MKDNEVINDLIQINNDRIRGYENAATQASDNNLRSLFKDMSAESEQCVQELRGLAVKEGGEPANGTTIRGKIYRAWMDLKAAFTGNDRKSLLASCEFGEDSLQRAYRSALKEPISASTRDLVEKQQRHLLQSHDRIRDLKDSSPS